METSKVIYIPKGSVSKIITHLNTKGYDLNRVDWFVLRFIGMPQSGWIDMGVTKLSRGDFLYKLTTAKAALQTITLLPGETTYIFLNQLAENLNLNRAKLEWLFLKYSSRPEGVLVPNTYRVPIGITEEEIIQLLLNDSKRQMMALSEKIFGNYNEKKWFGYVALASVIQKEAANNEEMPIVSSVIYNRINKGMKLQMDGTLNYGKFSHTKVTAARIREDNSPYNTYKIDGVPSIPVCNVSFEAIKAAIFPAKTDYIYFVKNKSGSHSFSCNYSTHLNNIRSATK